MEFLQKHTPGLVRAGGHSKRKKKEKRKDDYEQFSMISEIKDEGNLLKNYEL